LRRRLEPRAPGDRRDDEVQRRVLRVPALLRQVLRRAVGPADLHEFGPVALVFAEMDAETTLTFVHQLHRRLPLRGCPGPCVGRVGMARARGVRTPLLLVSAKYLTGDGVRRSLRTP